MLEQSPKAIALKWLQTFNEKDCDELLNLYYAHAYYKRIPGRDLVGKDEINDYLIKLCLIQDFYLESQNVLEDGQWAVLEWKDLYGRCGCEAFQIVNGQIVCQREYWDEAKFWSK